MYSLNPSNGKIKQLQAKEDVISDYSIANQAFEMVYFGLSASNSQRLYTYNLKNERLFLLDRSLQRDLERRHFRRSARLEFRFRPRGYDLRPLLSPSSF